VQTCRSADERLICITVSGALHLIRRRCRLGIETAVQSSFQPGQTRSSRQSPRRAEEEEEEEEEQQRRERTVWSWSSPSFLPMSLFIHCEFLSSPPLLMPGTTRGMIVVTRLCGVNGIDSGGRGECRKMDSVMCRAGRREKEV